MSFSPDSKKSSTSATTPEPKRITTTVIIPEPKIVELHPYRPIWMHFRTEGLSVGDKISSKLCVKGTSTNPLKVVFVNEHDNEFYMTPTTFDLSVKAVWIQVTWTKRSEERLENTIRLKSVSSLIPEYFINCVELIDTNMIKAKLEKPVQSLEEIDDLSLDKELAEIKDIRIDQFKVNLTNQLRRIKMDLMIVRRNKRAEILEYLKLRSKSEFYKLFITIGNYAEYLNTHFALVYGNDYQKKIMLNVQNIRKSDSSTVLGKREIENADPVKYSEFKNFLDQLHDYRCAIGHINILPAVETVYKNVTTVIKNINHPTMKIAFDEFCKQYYGLSKSTTPTDLILNKFWIYLVMGLETLIQIKLDIKTDELNNPDKKKV